MSDKLSEQMVQRDLGSAVSTAIQFGVPVQTFLQMCWEEWEAQRADSTKREQDRWRQAVRPA